METVSLVSDEIIKEYCSKDNIISNLYVIACMRHTYKNNYSICLWGPNQHGYTPNLDKAGRYTYDEIQKLNFFDENNRDDFAIELNYAYSISVEREYNYSGWDKCHCILNDEVFYNTFNINIKRLEKTRGDKQWWRYCK